MSIDRSSVQVPRDEVLKVLNEVKPADVEEEEDSDDEEDDEVADLPPPPAAQNYGARPRASVSAEAYGKWNQKKEFTPPVYNKSTEQINRLKKVLPSSLLFSSLDEKDLQTVIFAMQEKSLKTKERPIVQGDDGDVLYVIEKGVLDCYKKFDGEAEEKLVKTCEAGDVFGELALLYNVPRAASVEAREDSIVWILDRETFNAIVKDAAAKRRQMYEQFLISVPLLESMDAYERNKIADALKTETFKDGEFIIKQGDPGDKFFLLEEGNAIVTKADTPGAAAEKKAEYKAGDYFGELALLTNEPRAANVIAQGPCKCAVLDRLAFKRLLGPLQNMLQSRADRYR
uniref:cAMP-dependent protein kinase regulatory subunit n=1 Tax=Chromera velia CCMP2878 TaxID=1169474 RepID=A0A0G4FFU5_9ALVE|eukprot:Cvel_16764.t1-p1 / transcript=Cvel_16764.t1 / gene=Cvel_16764 / organism=Chromera_velia_CCMP2878 / gene_product=cAMP-dependent protein kinase regulatory subunit, putative / transcript_product=cAMP-dependent protein kinase regulatory subunit, putative / location=Cvel_scaffold1307:34348-37764(-) / protein_length=342 / sequence_SO=supercontig / SO=protein_coding / is_pseudo=false